MSQKWFPCRSMFKKKHTIAKRIVKVVVTVTIIVIYQCTQNLELTAFSLFFLRYKYTCYCRRGLTGFILSKVLASHCVDIKWTRLVNETQYQPTTLCPINQPWCMVVRINMYKVIVNILISKYKKIDWVDT